MGIRKLLAPKISSQSSAAVPMPEDKMEIINGTLRKSMLEFVIDRLRVTKRERNQKKGRLEFSIEIGSLAGARMQSICEY